ncbi:hypothetical protein [Nostoc sp. FACHB-280]|uniref:hypothetical protein n=1 Tax=Nostoc sp. FACHB-280 TaxID=2692839 RepID=UPI00168B7FF9|nr:hypothetical protein [Nostoc sp. FACHB-280]MBD2498220.1 hypothetical protein [Nostoc sp. FACHB-280]
MAQQSQHSLQHFNFLKLKYKASNFQDSSLSSLLYLILRKVELAIKISDLEFDWLQENQLLETIEIIQIQQYSLGEAKRLEAEFSHLKSKYKVAKPGEYSVDSFLYFILLKLESGNQLNNSELDLLQENNLNQTVAIVKDISNFLDLKKKYQATKSQDSYPDSRLYKILQKIDTAASLSDSEYEWLLNDELFDTIEIYEHQESAKQAEFNKLKVKYQVNKQIDTNLTSKLYQILKKIDADTKLNYEEVYWLEKQGLTETICIAERIEKEREFATLKVKYKATQYQEISTNSYLYLLLKRLETENYVSEDDFSFLKQFKLLETQKC